MQVIVITPIHSRRLQFVLDFVFVELAKTDYILVDSPPLDVRDDQVCINYHTGEFNSVECRVLNSGLLEENVSIPVEYWDGFDIENIELNEIDALALIFFLISRAEEYHDNSGDIHGRFQHKNSWSYRNNLIQIPIVDILVDKIFEKINVLKQRNVIGFKGEFQSWVTVDLDHMFAYKAKPASRVVGGLFRELIEGKWVSMKQRLTYLWNRLDPFDQHDFLINIIKEKGVKGKAFVLCANHGGVDNNIDPSHPLFKEVVKKWSAIGIGLHPSYLASQNEDQLKMEYALLNKICEQTITSSRMHFLKMKMPSTYQTLIKLGTKEDWTMGYADCIGFRSGTSHSHLWYDLTKEDITDLRIFPLVVMDGALKDYLGLNPKKASVLVKPIIESCRRYKGNFTLLWHNSSFADDGGWQGWDTVFEEILELMSDRD